MNWKPLFNRARKILSPRTLILFDRISLLSLFAAALFRLFKTDVKYLRLSRRFSRREVVALLEAAGIEIIDYAKFRYYRFDRHHDIGIGMALSIYDRLFGGSDKLTLYRRLFGSLQAEPEKLRVALIGVILSMLGELPDLVMCAEYFQGQYDRVKLYLHSTACMRMAEKDCRGIDGNVYFPLFSSAERLLLLPVRLARRCEQWLRSRKGNVKAQRKPEGEAGAEEVSSREVLFFPHQGVAYGSLFLKNHFYSDDPGNPFHPSNILHIEYGLNGVPDTERQQIFSYYRKHRIPFVQLVKEKRKGLLRQYLLFLLRHTPVGDWVRPEVCLRHLAVWRLYKDFSMYYAFVGRLKNAKIALIGYDTLFPKALSLALSTRGIVTAAAQERFIQPFFRKRSVLLDHYFINGEVIRKQLISSGTSFVQTVHTVGPVRADSIHRFKSEFSSTGPGCEPYRSIKTKYRLVVAFDYFSVPDEIGNCSEPIINWENNKAFYQDLMKLSIAVPDIYIVIRGKDTTWCSLPAFADLYGLISELPNIEVHKDFDSLYHSQRLVAQADLVIAKHTSIGDEALAAGVPVLFYDFAPNCRRVVSSIFDYASAPVFVYSYEELKERVVRIVSKSDYMEEACFQRLRSCFYNNASNAKVGEKIRSELAAIFVQARNLQPEFERNAPAAANLITTPADSAPIAGRT
jgi:hypothetical protein